MSLAETATYWRYRLIPDHVVGEILSKRWIDNTIPFLVLVLVIGGFGFVRAKAEGVQMPDMPKNISVGGASTGGASTRPSTPAPAPEPMGSPDDSAPSSDSTEA